MNKVATGDLGIMTRRDCGDEDIAKIAVVAGCQRSLPEFSCSLACSSVERQKAIVEKLVII